MKITDIKAYLQGRLVGMKTNNNPAHNKIIEIEFLEKLLLEIEINESNNN